MSLTIQRFGADLRVLAGAETLPEGEPVELFTAEEFSALQRQRLEHLQMQIPSFMRGDEDEDASALFELA